MIIVKLMGGLGNQMFQYAAGKSLSVTYNESLLLDITEFTNKIKIRDYTVREFGLNNFSIPYTVAAWEIIEKCVPGNKSFFQKLISKIFKKSADCIIITEEKFHSFKYKPAHQYYLNGYWQSEDYFKEIRELLIKEFTLSNILNENAKEIGDRINNCESVSLHIRRGDYVTNKTVYNVLGPCSLNYYHRSVNYIKEYVSDPYFFIFSDDIEWVKSNFKIEIPFEIVENIAPEIEMNLMSKCKHNIIANSSFSWWGAWLNANPEKIVIAPKIWFKNQQVNPYEIIPSNWVKIEN